MDLDEIEKKLNSGEFILVEKSNAKSKVWKIFREIRVTSTKESVGAVLCVMCQSIFTYSVSKTGSSHLNRHSCNVNANNGEDSEEESKKKKTLDVSPKPKKRKGVLLDKEQNESLDFSSPLCKKDKSECTEYDAIGIIVAAKIKKMNSSQQIYAESLISIVLKRGLLDTLTGATNLTEENAKMRDDITSHEETNQTTP